MWIFTYAYFHGRLAVKVSNDFIVGKNFAHNAHVFRFYFESVQITRTKNSRKEQWMVMKKKNTPNIIVIIVVIEIIKISHVFAVLIRRKSRLWWTGQAHYFFSWRKKKRFTHLHSIEFHSQIKDKASMIFFLL